MYAKILHPPVPDSSSQGLTFGFFQVSFSVINLPRPIRPLACLWEVTVTTNMEKVRVDCSFTTPLLGYHESPLSLHNRFA